MIPVSLALRRDLDKGAAHAVFAYEDAGLAGAAPLGPGERRELLAQAQAESFKGAPGECTCVSLGRDGRLRRYVLAGLGKKKELTPEVLRRAAGSVYQFAKNRFGELTLLPPEPAQAAAEGLMLASYRFDEYRKPDSAKLASAKILAQGEPRRAQAALDKAALCAEAVAMVRDLVNRGPSDKTPQSLAQLARSMAGPRLSVSVLGRKEATDLGMGAFLGVARGSSVEPAFIHLAYKPRGAKRKIALVGKGITFDSGGLSLKPPQSMEAMKMDMAGAAVVLAAFKVMERLGVKAEVHGYCAATYNMPGPDALKPGDVVRAINGKTIEVLNTDAEGRLILADALAFAAREKPQAIIDVATLTGAVVTALGSKVTGVMGNSRPLLDRLQAAAQDAGELVCELPLVRDYRDMIKSSIADLQNIGKARGEAGSIIGGLFLEEFAGGIPWAHCDIAGTAWTDSDGPTGPKGGTGAFARTVLEYLCRL